MTARKRPARETIQVLPAAAARGRGSAERRAAQRTAEALGDVVGDSDTVDADQREIAFAFDVRPRPGSGPRQAVIVAGAPRLEGLVILRVGEDRALFGLLLGKAIAALPPENLLDGASVHVEVEGVVSTVRLTAAPAVADKLAVRSILMANLGQGPRSK